MIKSYNKGISVIEILIVVIVLAILFTITSSEFFKFREGQVLKGATSDILSALNKARAETLGSVDSSEYGVHFESDQVIIFKGTTFSAGAGDNEVISITSPANISNVTLGGVSDTEGDVYFSRLYGAPSDTGTITISTSSISKIITISATGVVSVN